MTKGKGNKSLLEMTKLWIYWEKYSFRQKKVGHAKKKVKIVRSTLQNKRNEAWSRPLSLAVPFFSRLRRIKDEWKCMNGNCSNIVSSIHGNWHGWRFLCQQWRVAVVEIERKRMNNARDEREFFIHWYTAGAWHGHFWDN